MPGTGAAFVAKGSAVRAVRVMVTNSRFMVHFLRGESYVVGSQGYPGNARTDPGRRGIDWELAGVQFLTMQDEYTRESVARAGKLAWSRVRGFRVEGGARSAAATQGPAG